MNLWLFGYGSLIWRPDIDFVERRAARIHGWARRFWQGSHDHRGLPDDPGRVVTLIEDEAGHCDGMAYLVDRELVEETFVQLDHREKNGYERHRVSLEFQEPFQEGNSSDGVVYIAPLDNHAYLGPAPMAEMARQIQRSEGPSGKNIDYLLELASALRMMKASDSHVFDLEAAVKELE
jgi:cation transport regulator ChaC